MWPRARHRHVALAEPTQKIPPVALAVPVAVPVAVPAIWFWPSTKENVRNVFWPSHARFQWVFKADEFATMECSMFVDQFLEWGRYVYPMPSKMYTFKASRFAASNYWISRKMRKVSMCEKGDETPRASQASWARASQLVLVKLVQLVSGTPKCREASEGVGRLQIRATYLCDTFAPKTDL